ncbi:9367_t:CDS:2 [Ambispora leptoticha]|uniref:9367_t:CDS:1 n=1 Tax=Ambispora leptoticha TaxID=144679 RepID=A0A9N8ZI24_9GLOM|nr:9367_t:CDS:2 [Ambispora leptoticha]
MSKPVIFAEILPNIKSMNLTLGLPSNNNPLSFNLGIYASKLTFEQKQPPQRASSISTLHLSNLIEATENPSITSTNDGLDIKLRLRTYVRKKPTRQTIGSDIIPPLTAKELGPLKSILCSWCKFPLVNSNAFIKVMDLPSEHWLELLDCWMCHQEDYQQALLGDVIAKEKIAMVGNTYILVHPSDILKPALDLEDGMSAVDPVDTPGPKLTSELWLTGLSRKWLKMCCSRCLASVGEGLYTIAAEDLEDNNESSTGCGSAPTLLAVKFNKYMTVVELSAPENRAKIVTHSFAPFVAANFLEAAKAHATYRFVIESNTYDLHPHNKVQPYLLVDFLSVQIWLFSWDTKILTNALEGDDGDNTTSWQNKFSPRVMMGQQGPGQVMWSDMKARDVLKILYIDCTIMRTEKEDRTSTQSSLIEQWEKDKSVEHFTYREEICLEILLMLRLSTSSLPPSQRKAMDGQFSVGFLDRVDF